MYLCLPLIQGVLVTVHFLFSVCGMQVCEGTKAGEVSGLWTWRRGTRTRDCEPFLNPHVLFFFIQELHGLHSPSSQSEERGWNKEWVSELFTAPVSHICFAAFLSDIYSSAVKTQGNELKSFPNLKTIVSVYLLAMDLRREGCYEPEHLQSHILLIINIHYRASFNNISMFSDSS